MGERILIFYGGKREEFLVRGGWGTLRRKAEGYCTCASYAGLWGRRARRKRRFPLVHTVFPAGDSVAARDLSPWVIFRAGCVSFSKGEVKGRLCTLPLLFNDEVKKEKLRKRLRGILVLFGDPDTKRPLDFGENLKKVGQTSCYHSGTHH